MKTTMSVSVEQELKKQFMDFAKSIGTNPTNLLNMFMVETIHTWEIRFKRNYLEIEFSDFSPEESENLEKKWKVTSSSIFDALDTQLWK
jgi:antitoxin component of RelBE/YafQ-DinJ toxin-antitoxin module